MTPLGDVREGEGWQDIPPIGEGIGNDDAIVFATPTHLVTVIKGKTVNLSDYLKRVSAGTTTPPYQHLTPPPVNDFQPRASYHPKAISNRIPGKTFWDIRREAHAGPMPTGRRRDPRV